MADLPYSQADDRTTRNHPSTGCLAGGWLARDIWAESASSPQWIPPSLVVNRTHDCRHSRSRDFILPSFVGVLLVQMRMSTLERETPIEVAAEMAGRVVVELLWLRAALQRSLVGFAVVISGAVLTAGALRSALIANGASAKDVPVVSILTFGGFPTVLIALIFVPAYVGWQERVIDLRDQLYPVPKDGLPPHDWYQARSDFDTLLTARSSAGSVLAATFGILAPLAGSLVTALIPVS